MFKWFRKNTPPALNALLDQLQGRYLIIHRGFPPSWLAELLKQPGGGGYLRIDLLVQNNKNPTPLEAFVHAHLAHLDKAVPCIALIEGKKIFVRRLMRAERWMHSAEINDLLLELNHRYHYRIDFSESTPQIAKGLSLDENDIKYDI
jgi:hypothetical protein